MADETRRGPVRSARERARDGELEKPSMAAEEWREAPGFEGLYDISSHGRVRSWLRRGSERGRRESPVLMTQDARGGYLRASLRTPDKKKVSVSPHVLMATAFLGPRPTPEHQARHLDGNSFNNQLSNIKWGTRAENQDDRVRHGTDPVGSRNGRAKLTEAQVLEIRQRDFTAKGAIAQAAREFGVTWAAMNYVVNGVTWKHVVAE